MAQSKLGFRSFFLEGGGLDEDGPKKLSWNFQNYCFNSLGDIKILIYFFVILP
jgi:hypothetical protein